MVLLDREPLALRCALLSAAASGLHLAQVGEPHGGLAAGSAEGSRPVGGSSALEPEPLQGWIWQQQQQLRGQQQREGQQGAGEGLLQFSDEGGAQVAAEAVSRTLQRVISGVERATAGAALGDTGSTVAGGAAPPSTVSDGEAPRQSNGTSDPSPAAVVAVPVAFSATTCSVTGALRLPEFRFEGAAAIARLMEGQLSSSSSEGQQGPGGSSGSGATGAAEGDWISSSSVKGDPAGSSTEGSSRNGVMRARVFDWNHADLLGEQYNVLLACDVLYEDAAVGPIAALVPRWDDETSQCIAAIVPRGHGLGFKA